MDQLQQEILEAIQYLQFFTEKYQKEPIQVPEFTKLTKIFENLRAWATKPELQIIIKNELKSLNINIYHMIELIQKQGKNFEKQASFDSFFLQFLSNIITGNEENKEFIFEQIKSIETQNFKKIYLKIVENKNDHKFLKFITIFLHNFLEKLTDYDGIFLQFISSQNIKTLVQIILEDFFTNTDHEFEEQSQTAQFNKWILLMIAQFFKTQDFPKKKLQKFSENKEKQIIQNQQNISIYQYFINIFDEIQDNSQKEKYKQASFDFFIQLFQSFLDQKVQPSFLYEFIPDSMDIRCSYMNYKENMFKFSIADLDYILEQLIQNSEQLLEETYLNIDNIQKSELDAKIKSKINQHLQVVFESLRILSQITFLGGYNKNIQIYIYEYKNQIVLKNILEMLKLFRILNTTGTTDMKNLMKQVDFSDQLQKEYDQLQDEKFSNETSQERKQQIENERKQKLRQIQDEIIKQKLKLFQKVFDSCLSEELFSNTLRVLSNLTHIQKPVQDYISQNNYLQDCLSFSSGVEVHDPLSREWSIVLIRNLCDSNDEIQDKIAAMKVIHFDDKIKEIVQKYQMKRKELENIAEMYKDMQIQKNQQNQQE
ncbi:Armadillo-type fold [Pseudocohnilembus persalinus]|uniref:Armadillo-type fold n=1 Tax=Pseudocohnilembus persalinus TaxID=266149 RepID=A0A0V0R812_PSEPJ|nr:Armadillo-type fold [Pseudocohnilembus persalinus]|eukprot:KRX10631.1 Armadillo-type fold [Pseudocohnilembus persalinus]